FESHHQTEVTLVSLPTSLWASMREEFKRTPIAVFAAVGGLVVAIISLLVAASGLSPAPKVSAPPATSVDVNPFVLRNFLLVASFFLAATTSSATLIRLLARVRRFGAVLVSVPAAATSSFLTLAIWRMWPPRGFTPETLPDALDLVFYATVVVYASITGGAVLRDIARTSSVAASIDETKGETKEAEVTGGLEVLFSAGLFLLIWTSVTRACLERLVQLFLM
ncbi:hypothetical protein, partial [Longimicrobium sp.]|uniref:hypothetical protein n=1 Tax=Longimicrobium sp. TaxID=2029185 RepID=UPI002E2F6D9D